MPKINNKHPKFKTGIPRKEISGGKPTNRGVKRPTLEIAIKYYKSDNYHL